MSITVELGNPAPLDAEGESVTTVKLPEGTSLLEAFQTITAREGVWRYHAQPDTKPSWVESTNDSLASLLAEHFGCKVGRAGAKRNGGKSAR